MSPEQIAEIKKHTVCVFHQVKNIKSYVRPCGSHPTIAKLPVNLNGDIVVVQRSWDAVKAAIQFDACIRE